MRRAGARDARRARTLSRSAAVRETFRRARRGSDGGAANATRATCGTERFRRAPAASRRRPTHPSTRRCAECHACRSPRSSRWAAACSCRKPGTSSSSVTFSTLAARRSRACVSCRRRAATIAPYVARFYESYGRLGASLDTLRFFRRTPADLRAYLAAYDVVHVGGGNTRSMLAVWRHWGFDDVLRDVWRSGDVALRFERRRDLLVRGGIDRLDGGRATSDAVPRFRSREVIVRIMTVKPNGARLSGSRRVRHARAGHRLRRRCSRAFRGRRARRRRSARARTRALIASSATAARPPRSRLMPRRCSRRATSREQDRLKFADTRESDALVERDRRRIEIVDVEA